VGGLLLALIMATRFVSGGQGDPLRGADMYESNVAVCFACHNIGIRAPVMVGVRVLVRDVRLKVPENSSKTPEQYLAESIWYHNAYVSRDYQTQITPSVYRRLLSLRDVQDLVAYLLTL
jgi:hypothetical protein